MTQADRGATALQYDAPPLRLRSEKRSRSSFWTLCLRWSWWARLIALDACVQHIHREAMDALAAIALPVPRAMPCPADSRSAADPLSQAELYHALERKRQSG